MEKIILELKILKPNGFCVFVVGDHFKGKQIINTSKELSVIFEKHGFTYHESLYPLYL